MANQITKQKTMKKTIFILSVCSVSIGLFALKKIEFQNNFELSKPVNAGGAAAGKTGAPGEQTCTACHAGSAQDGGNENVLSITDGGTEVTNYVPGQQYDVTLSMSSNPAKKGFQSTALLSNNAMAGSFTGVAGNTNINGTTKKYANHTTTSNTNATPTWTWSWTAPSTGSGDVTFYVASNKANNNGANSGDVIYLSQHTISEQSNASVSNQNFNPDLTIKNTNGMVDLAFYLNKVSNVALNVIDLNGKSVYNQYCENVSSGKNVLQLDLTSKKGLHILHVFIDNKPFSLKFYL